jgi:hypothetical protein
MRGVCAVRGELGDRQMCMQLQERGACCWGWGSPPYVEDRECLGRLGVHPHCVPQSRLVAQRTVAFRQKRMGDVGG